ncbi:MAG: hypothetical protein R2706_02495 [Acidimicrobiales bacterium]
MTDSTSTQPILTVEDIVLRFGGVTAIDGVSFHVNPNELSRSSAQMAPARRRSSTA